MSTLSATISPKQWEVLLLAGLEVEAQSIKGGLRVIQWPIDETPRLFWTLDKLTPRHKCKAKPYINLQMVLFNALRHHRATNG